MYPIVGNFSIEPSIEFGDFPALFGDKFINIPWLSCYYPIIIRIKPYKTIFKS